MATLSKKAAVQATDILDKAATLLQTQHKALGISSKAAARIAWNLDAMSDHIEKSAGINPKDVRQKQALTGFDVYKEPGFDPEQIGQEVGGPLEQEPDEPYMSAEFSQQENRELREKQQAGELPDGSDAPQAPKAGIQASLDTGAKLAQAYLDIAKAASACAKNDHVAVKTLGTKLATTGLGILQFQTRVLEGRETAARAAALLTGTGHVLPHLAGDLTPEVATKLARMTDILAGLTKSAEDDEEKKGEDDAKESGKKARAAA